MDGEQRIGSGRCFAHIYCRIHNVLLEDIIYSRETSGEDARGILYLGKWAILKHHSLIDGDQIDNEAPIVKHVRLQKQWCGSIYIASAKTCQV